MNIFTKFLLLVCLLACNKVFAQAPKSMYDGEKRIYYTDMADAKNKLIEYHKEKHYKSKDDNEFDSSLFPFEMFKDLVLHDDRAFNFNFAFDEITELKSNDNRVKLYSWDNHKGGAVNRIYDGITTYKYDEEYYAYAVVWDEYDEYSENQNGNIVTSCLSKIETITSALGKTIYLVFDWFRWEGLVNESVKAYSLSDGRLVSEFIFNVNERKKSVLSNYFQPDFATKNTQNLKYVNGELLIPQKWNPEKLNVYSEAMIASGLVDVYKYDGFLFNLYKTIYSSDEPLYSDLENFKHNILNVELGSYIIRIDCMKNGTYRYSSWKNKKVREKPDIIINNGLLLESISENKGWGSVKEKYVFENNGYYYIVSFGRTVYNRFISIEDAILIVKRNDKTLMEIKAK